MTSIEHTFWLILAVVCVYGFCWFVSWYYEAIERDRTVDIDDTTAAALEGDLTKKDAA